MEQERIIRGPYPKSKISQISTGDHTDVLMEILNRNFEDNNGNSSAKRGFMPNTNDVQRKTSKKLVTQNIA